MHHPSPLNRSHQFPESRNYGHSPYGISFEDEQSYKRAMMQRYKEDLDYLCSLKRRFTTENDATSDQLRIQRMNDKYYYDRLSHQTLMKEFNAFNEKAAQMKKQQQQQNNIRKQNEYFADVNQFNNQINFQLSLERDKKEKIKQEKEHDLQNYLIKKEHEKQIKMKENEQNKILFKEESSRFLDNEYEQYRNKISKMNNNIYSHAKSYSNYIGNDYKKDLYDSNNDFDYNRKIAEMQAKGKNDHIVNIDKYLAMRQQEKKEKMDYERSLFNKKMNLQKNYRDYLDGQMQQRLNARNSNRNILTESAEQLLMPSYKYPNLPQAVVKKAFDPLVYYSKTPKSMSPLLVDNNSMSTGIGSSSAMYKERGNYLGDSRLRHNPITCPVDDVEYNKYVNKELYHIYYGTGKGRNQPVEEYGEQFADNKNAEMMMMPQEQQAVAGGQGQINQSDMMGNNNVVVNNESNDVNNMNNNGMMMANQGVVQIEDNNYQ